PTESPSCTIIVCTRDRPDELDRCLEAISSLEYGAFEVLVVDNAPSDRRAEDVVYLRQAKYVVEPTPGLSRARNRGAHEASNDVIAYLDDDCVPDRRWLAELMEPFQDPSIMATTGKTMPAAAK